MKTGLLRQDLSHNVYTGKSRALHNIYLLAVGGTLVAGYVIAMVFFMSLAVLAFVGEGLK